MLAVRTLKTAEISKEGKREMFYLMKYSTHFISGYVALLQTYGKGPFRYQIRKY